MDTATGIVTHIIIRDTVRGIFAHLVVSGFVIRQAEQHVLTKSGVLNPVDKRGMKGG